LDPKIFLPTTNDLILNSYFLVLSLILACEIGEQTLTSLREVKVALLCGGSERLDCYLNLFRFQGLLQRAQTARANQNFHTGEFFGNEIRLETTTRAAFRMRDIIAGNRSFATKATNFTHWGMLK
jgi:hypothetical protein